VKEGKERAALKMIRMTIKKKGNWAEGKKSEVIPEPL